jgi:hypothetical protein
MPDDPLTNGATTTAKQFARSVVRDRSRILHGTWSTLNSRLAFNRNGLENFVITVIRRAALELEIYALTASPEDNIDDFLAWVKRREAARDKGLDLSQIFVEPGQTLVVVGVAWRSGRQLYI